MFFLHLERWSIKGENKIGMRWYGKVNKLKVK